MRKIGMGVKQDGADLAAENGKLRKENADLAAENGKLRKENADLAAENGKLRKLLNKTDKKGKNDAIDNESTDGVEDTGAQKPSESDIPAQK